MKDGKGQTVRPNGSRGTLRRVRVPVRACRSLALDVPRRYMGTVQDCGCSDASRTGPPTTGQGSQPQRLASGITASWILQLFPPGSWRAVSAPR